MKLFRMTLPAAFALAIAVAASPAAAQGKSGHGGGQGQAHPQHETARAGTSAHGKAHTTTRAMGTMVRRGTTATSTRSAPPGWCKGRGNPHNTAANCGYRTDRIYRDRNGVWRDRYGNRLVSGYVYRDRTGTIRDFLGRLLR
ncbi:MAG TPA: hypothetical protein VFH27_12560 [Longimicrobiaceae bacterium]|nr:hypothetical protein [Longimicrobiaceae bacterium]